MLGLQVESRSVYLQVFLIAALVVSTGCATSDKRLVMGDLSTVETMTIARFNTPPLLKETIGAQAVGVTGVMFGAIGGGIGGALYYKMMESSGKAVQEQCNLPDFCELIVEEFREKLPQKVEDWPEIDVAINPVDKNFKNGSEYVLLIGVGMLKIRNGRGLIAITTAQLRDSQDQILWKKRFDYESKKFDRPSGLKELEANHGTLLKEEYKFAAEKAVQVFIEHLNGNSPEP